MAEELKIRVSLNNAIFGELKTLEKSINDFGKRVNQSIKTNLNFNTNLKLFQGQNDPTRRVEQSIDRVNATLRRTLSEVDRSIDEILKRVDKVFDNIFVGLDNIFSLGRNIRLRLGAFFGDARATVIFIVNDITNLLRSLSPFLKAFTQFIQMNRKDLLKTLADLSKFLSQLLNGLRNSQQFSQKLTDQAKRFVTSSEFTILNNFVRTRKLPITEQVGIFFEIARRFFVNINIQIERVVQLLAFAFNFSQKELQAIDVRARELSRTANDSLNRVSEEVFELFNRVEKKGKGLFARLAGFFGAILTSPFKALGIFLNFFIIKRFQILGRIVNKLFVRPIVEDQKRKQELKEEERKQKDLERLRKQFIARDIKDRTEASNKVLDFLNKEKEQVGKLQQALVDFSKAAVNIQRDLQKIFSSSVFSDANENERVLRNLQRAATRDVAASLREFQTAAQQIDTSIKKIFSLENIKLFKSSLLEINKTLVLLSSAVRRLQVDFTKFGENLTMINEKTKQATKDSFKSSDISEGFKKANEEVKKAGEQVVKYREALVDVAKQAQAVDFSKFQALEKFQFGKSAANSPFLNDIKVVFTAIARSQFNLQETFREQSIKTIEKNIGRLIEFFAILDGVLKNTNREFAKFGEILAKSGNFRTLDINASRELTKNLFRAFTKEELEKNAQLRNFGAKITQVLGDSIRSGDKKAFKDGINALVKFLATTIPKDKRLVASGKLIPQQLGEGVESNIKAFDKAMEKTAQTGANRFPQSLAKVGVLRNLPKSGSLIPAQLAAGIINNLAVVTQAANRMASIIIAPINLVVDGLKNTGSGFAKAINDVINNANKIGDISATTGANISAINRLDGLFREIGQTAGDNAIVFSRIQRTLNEINPQRENSLRQIGIDLQEIRESGEPTVELFSRVSDVIQTLPPASAEARQALEAIGLTVDNKLVGVLRRGGEEVRQIINQSTLFGGAINSTVIEVSQELRSIFSNLGKIFDSLKADFIGEILPVVRDFSQGVLTFFNDNADRIRQFFIFLGRAFGNLIRVAIVFFKLAATEPKKAIEIAKSTFLAFVTLVEKIIKIVVRRVTTNVTNEVKFKFLAALDGLKQSVFNIFTLVGEQFDLRIAQGLLLIEKFLTNLDILVTKFGNTFLDTTRQVAGRWIKIAIAVVEQLFVSVKNFFLNVVDRGKIFFLNLKLGVQETIRDILDSIPRSAANLLGIQGGLDSLNAGIKNTADEIINLSDEIGKRNDIDDFFTRAVNAVNKVRKEIKSTDELFAEINQKIAAANERFADGVKENFTRAFAEAEILIEQANKATAGLFDKEAIAEYNEALDEAKTKIVAAVEGTELSEPVKKLIDELSTEYIEKLKELKDAAPDTLIPEGTEDKVDSLQERLNGLISIFQTVGSVVNNFAGVFQSAFEATGRQSRALFIASKAAAVAQATINTAVAVTEALKLPPPLNIIQPPLIAAQGGIQVGIIAREAIQGFQEGGQIPGGEGGGDTVPIMAEPGEFMMPLDVVKANGLQFMEAIRSGIITARDFTFSRLPSVIHSPTTQKFQDGGFVKPPKQSPTNGGGQQGDKMTQIVNVPDKEMVGRFLNTSKGNDIILNIISDNAVEIKQLMGIE